MISSAQKYSQFFEQEQSGDYCPEHKTREEHERINAEFFAAIEGHNVEGIIMQALSDLEEKDSEDTLRVELQEGGYILMNRSFYLEWLFDALKIDDLEAGY